MSRKPKVANNTFSNNLKHLLEVRGISQRAAAELAGCAPSVINSWLAGSAPADYSALLKLCQALSADFQYLLSGQRSGVKLSDVPLEDIFKQDEQSSFDGIYKISAVRLVKK